MSDIREQLQLEIDQISQYQPCQASLVDQLNALYQIANKFGLYDAADFLAGTPTGWSAGLGHRS